MTGEISDSHGGDHEDGCLLDCIAVQSGTSVYVVKKIRMDVKRPKTNLSN